MSSCAAVSLLLKSRYWTPGKCLIRHISSKKKFLKREEINNTVFQYAGKNLQRADRLYGWGSTATGALGLKTLLKPEHHQRVRLKQFNPLRIDFLREQNLKVLDVSCGYGFTIFLCETSAGKSVVYGTGLNTDSQLGFNEYPRRSGRILDYVIEPAPIDLPFLKPETTKITHVASGRAHTIIVTDSEGVFSLGNNSYGQCFRPVVEDEIYRGSQVINKIDFQHPIKQVVCGQDHTLLLTEGGQVYSCGLGTDGQTGLEHYGCSSQPTLVRGDIEGEKIVHLASKADTVLAVSEAGQLFGWGNSEYDQLSIAVGDAMQVNIPRHLPFKNVGHISKAAAAGSMCAIVNSEGQLFTWGFGILGRGPKVDRCPTPEPIPQKLFGINEYSTDSKVVEIKSGLYYFAALTGAGNLYVWGKNRSACLGLGHVLDQFFPYKVHVPAEVQKFGCGVDHMITICKSFT